MSKLENTIIADIKDAERVGTRKPLADYTSEELEAKVNELETMLNTDIVDTYEAKGEYQKAQELEDEIHMVKSVREQNSAQK
jgi:transcription elongation GreA/GreB family factor